MHFSKLLFIPLSLLFFCSQTSFSQERNLDSLETVYINGEFDSSNELFLLSELANFIQDPQKKLEYSQVFKQKAVEMDSSQYLSDALFQEGNAYLSLGNPSDALDSYLEISRLAQENKDARMLALSEVTIGDVYAVMGNHENAVTYYSNGIDQLRQLDENSGDLASALLNAGDEYFNAGKYDLAMSLFLESSLIFNQINYKEGSALNIGNIGLIYAKKGKSKLAEANINEAILILEELKNYYAISIYLTYMADIYLEAADHQQALIYANRSLELASKYGLTEEISIANQELANIYEELGRHEESLFHFKEYVRFRDSINNVLTVQELADQRTAFELSKKQIEVDLINEQSEQQKLIARSIAVLLLVTSSLSYVLFRRNKLIDKTRKSLDQERQKSNNLLENILPEETAAELKDKGHVKAKKYQNVTILFSDFKGFTKYAEKLPPEKLVETVDLYFSEFDRIMDKYDIEKIKTLGDAYMCASGLPIPEKEHAEKMIRAASEMLKYVEKLKEVHTVDEVRFEIKIGINTGPVVAGVVGKRKFAYDIWGDSVNIAARMETTCEPGKVNVSEATYQLVKDKFEFESRGSIEIKNRGSIEMYYLKA